MPEWNTPYAYPTKLSCRSIHIIGKPGMTKSTTMGWQILDDISKGKGVVVIDPHGDLVEDLLRLIKSEYIEKTIYFDPGNPDYVPIWNPLKITYGQDLSRTADDIVAAIKSVVSGWGDRLEHLLKHGLLGLLHLPACTLLDLSNILRKGSDESNRLKKEILEVVENPTAQLFWKKDFDRYSNEAFDPPKHKLSKLLLAGTVALMLSQPESLFNFRQIMDEGMILFVNLSNIGSEVREILGCFILSLLHLAAISRSDIPRKDRKEFKIYADEVHRFITNALDDLIVEARKYRTNLTLAHHFLDQFRSSERVGALSSVGTTIIMNVDRKDAHHLTKDLRGLVDYEDIMNLQVGEAIVRLGTEVVKVRLRGPLEIPEQHFKEEIIQHSLKHYYKPVHVVRKFLKSRDTRWDRPFDLLAPEHGTEPEEFVYEEF